MVIPLSLPISSQKSDQPCIDSFLSQVEDDDEFLHSVAVQNGVKDFVSPIKPGSSTKEFEERNNESGSSNSSIHSSFSGLSNAMPKAPTLEVTNARSKPSRRLSPTKALPPQRNTLRKYFSPTKRGSDGETSATVTNTTGSGEGKPHEAESRKEEANEEEFLDDFNWLPPDDEEDPFLSQQDASKKRRLC